MVFLLFFTIFTVKFILKDKKIIFSRYFCTFLLEMITFWRAS